MHYNALSFHLQNDSFQRILANAKLQLLLADISLRRARLLVERPVEDELAWLRQRVADLKRQLAAA